MKSFSEKITELLFCVAIGALCLIIGILTDKMGEFAFLGLAVIVAFLEVRKATKQLKKRMGKYEYEEEEDTKEVEQEVIEEIIQEPEEPRAKLMREEENPDAFRVDLTECKVYVTSVEQLDDAMDQSFENFCANLLEKSGYSIVKERSNGINLLVTNELRKYAVMCKQSTQPLMEEDILKLEEGKQHYNGYIGVMMTNGRIDSDAIRLGNSKGLLLWDRAVMHGMIEKLKGQIDL